MPKKLRKQLLKALAGMDAGADNATVSVVSFAEYYAAVVAEPDTVLDRLATSFLNAYQIVEIERFTAKKHTLLYLGFAAGRELYPLTGKPENFSRLALGDGVAITSPEEAGEFVEVYLQVTARAGELFYRVDSVDEVMFRPNLDGEEAEQKGMFIDHYGEVIGPPVVVEAAGDGYRVSLFAVREQSLERHEITVSQGGEIGHTAMVLEEDLPLVYGGRV